MEILSILLSQEIFHRKNEFFLLKRLKNLFEKDFHQRSRRIEPNNFSCINYLLKWIPMRIMAISIYIYIYILALIGIENDLWNVRVNTLYAYRMQNGGPMYARLVEDAWRI